MKDSLKSRLKRLNRYKNNELKDLVLPSLIANKLDLSEDIIKQILDMQKNLLKKNHLNLYQNGKIDNDIEQKSSISLKSAPPPEDKEAKKMFLFMKNNKLKRTLSNRRLKEPLEFLANRSETNIKKNKNNLKKKKLDFLNILPYKDDNDDNKSRRSRLSRMSSRNGRSYKQSLSDSEDSNDSISAISKRSKIMNNDISPQEFGQLLNATTSIILKSRKSISKPKEKMFRKRFSFMPNMSQGNDLRRFKGNNKSNTPVKNRLRKMETINVAPKKSKDKNSKKKKNSLNYNKERNLDLGKNTRKISKTNASNKLKKNGLSDYLPRDDSVVKKTRRKTGRPVNGKAIDKTKYKAEKNITPKKYKNPKVTKEKKKFDKSKQPLKKQKTNKEIKNEMQIKINGIVMEEDELQKSMRSDSDLSSGDSIGDLNNKNTNLKKSSSNNFPLLGIPKRKTIKSRKKILITHQNNPFEVTQEGPNSNITTPSFPIDRRFTVNSTDIKEGLTGIKGDRSSKFSESLEMINEITENRKGLKISSNKQIFSLSSRKGAKSYEKSSFKNYFNLKSTTASTQEQNLEFSEFMDTTMKQSTLSVNMEYMRASNFQRKKTNESNVLSLYHKPGKKKRILLASHVNKMIELDEFEPRRKKRKNMLNTSNDFINLFPVNTQNPKMNSRRYFK